MSEDDSNVGVQTSLPRNNEVSGGFEGFIWYLRGAHRKTEAEARSVAAVGLEKETQPFLLVHDEKAQAILDKHVIARGIQFEIVRGISQGLWGWDCISEANAMKLRGRNSEVAPLLSQIINSGKTEGGITPLVLASRAAILYVHPTALTLLSLTRSIALNSIENTTHD